VRELLIHVSGSAPETLTAALRSAKNAAHAFTGEHVPIHVVVQGPLVRHLTANSPGADDVTATLGPNLHVHVHACQNSMNSANVTGTDLLPGVTTVPSAVAYLAEKKWDGAAYVTL
jgi:intracellular sulfur oxidation DsrE/DsrF family protein